MISRIASVRGTVCASGYTTHRFCSGGVHRFSKKGFCDVSTGKK